MPWHEEDMSIILTATRLNIISSRTSLVIFLLFILVNPAGALELVSRGHGFAIHSNLDSFCTS